jgi:RimJ/RimL family protein N-acetyltransferase
MRAFRLLREPVKLRDERTVVLRPIDPSDAERLMDLHNHLSFEAQYYRFFGPKPQLTRTEAEYLANVDFHKRFAIVAEAEIDGEQYIVGVGRFDINEPGIAEAAIVIRDDFQHVGLGTAMLERMREVGKGAGLTAFKAEILAENQKMLDLLEQQNVSVEPAREGIISVQAPLDAPIALKLLRAPGAFAGVLLRLLPQRS